MRIIWDGSVHLPPIQIAPLQAHDEHFRRGKVGGDGNIVPVAVPDGFDHLSMSSQRIGGVGIGEQQHQVNLSL